MKTYSLEERIAYYKRIIAALEDLSVTITDKELHQHLKALYNRDVKRLEQLESPNYQDWKSDLVIPKPQR